MKINKFTDVNVGSLVRINERYDSNQHNHIPKIKTTDILEVTQVYYYLGTVSVKTFGTDSRYYIRIAEVDFVNPELLCLM